MAKLRIGVTLPTISEVGTSGIGDIAASARHAEDLGLDSVWVPDLIIGDGMPSLEATLALATAAAVTDRVHVGFSVLVLPLRPVAWVAAQIATLQHLSGNRVLLGIGSGASPDAAFWHAVGVPGGERGRRTDAALRVLPGLIAGAATRLGPDQPVITLAPSAPVPPILIGGNSDIAIRRAATYGGWFPSLRTPDTLAAGAAKLRSLAADQQRATPTIFFGTHAVLGDDQDARSAREALTRSLLDAQHGLSAQDAATISITGGPQQAAERFAAYAAAGAEHLVIAPTGGPGWMRQYELIAETQTMLN